MKTYFARSIVWVLILSVFRLMNTGLLSVAHAASPQTTFDPQRLEKLIVVGACDDPMQMEVLENGQVLFIERDGSLKLSQTASPEAVEIGRVPVATFGEVGMLGLAIDRQYSTNGFIYLFFCPEQSPATMRVSRFQIVDQKLASDSEVKLLEYAIDVDGAIHMGGGMWMDPHGNLLIGTGDNCPPIPELPVDRRPGRSGFDAMRTSANSQDLRGKILRIHPNADGSVSIPENNLFTDSEIGRPEIFAMGCRNPFRVTVDPVDGTVYWGDVGPNIQLDLGIGPNGFDEINRTRTPGNFGWPMFVGPNEPFRLFDFESRTAGPVFDTNNPINDSPNNTGTKFLPAPQPAFLWYPSGESELWPNVGSGGRSAFAGPVYRAEQFNRSVLRLPEQLDGHVFVYEWTRNWIRTTPGSETGRAGKLTAFLPETVFRKPMDMKIGPDGTLYVIEYGDKWGGNTDSQIVRIVYRRGNRAPRAVVHADPPAGRHPLKVNLTAAKSADPDGDRSLNFTWKINGRVIENIAGEKGEYEFQKPGSYLVSVTVTDPSGAESEAATEVRVGNAAPTVSLKAPLHGSFVEAGQTVRYQIDAMDSEDGSLTDGRIPSGRVLLNRQFVNRRHAAHSDATNGNIDEALLDPGLALMRKTTCFSCHTTKSQSAGPPYREVGRKYASDPTARERLAAKIIAGGTGVWGNKPMPPHPQHSVEQTRRMVDWILSLATDTSADPMPGAHGFFRHSIPTVAGPGGNAMESGVLLLTAEYTDNGLPEVPGVVPIRSEQTAVLHTRRKRAAFFDRRSGAELVDVFERGAGLVARFAPGDWIAFEDMRLEDVDRVQWNIAALGKSSGKFSLRLDSPDGPELCSISLEGNSDQLGEVFSEQTVAIQAPEGLHDVYITALDHNGQRSQSSTGLRTLSLGWIEFMERPELKAKRLDAESAVKKVVLIPTKLDHPWATHMYSDVCRLLAASLNQTPGVEAVVSPELDWPSDPALLADADAIVYYSRPAGDILLTPERMAQFRKLLDRKVGFTAIHWATGAETNVGDQYQEILGGWFNFAFSGIKVDIQSLVQLQPDHPICRGWSGSELRDEFYLNLRFSPSATPILNVNVDGKDQTVAWVLNRSDGGRSFGTTLGHFHDNYEREDFRRMMVNGILWTAGVDVPEHGANVDIEPEMLRLPELPKAIVREWKHNDLIPLLERPLRNRSFENGEKLFQQATCAACHRMGQRGGQLGPDLTDVRTRMARHLHPSSALMREIVDPSHAIEEKYRTHILQLTNGQVINGILVSEDDGILTLAANPAKPDERVRIALSDIDDRGISSVSMMPTGLLNTLQAEEILDLFAYVESGGNPDYYMFKAATIGPEQWSIPNLPVKAGLQIWLDAKQLNPGRTALQLPVVASGQKIDLWPDASGYRRHVSQRQANAQPILHESTDGPIIVLDGVDDYLTAHGCDLKTREFTAVVLFRPHSNDNWPGILSGNTFQKNDYQSGFNIDLMNETRPEFSSVMVEGPGYAGIINLMKIARPYGQFSMVTVTSRPGAQGVQLRVNGQPQGERDRPDSIHQLDEFSVGTRFWSNDNGIPPFNRGFLKGDFKTILFYNRILSDSEIQSLEKWLE